MPSIQHPSIIASLISILVHVVLFGIFTLVWEQSPPSVSRSVVFLPEGAGSGSGRGYRGHLIPPPSLKVPFYTERGGERGRPYGVEGQQEAYAGYAGSSGAWSAPTGTGSILTDTESSLTDTGHGIRTHQTQLQETEKSLPTGPLKGHTQEVKSGVSGLSFPAPLPITEPPRPVVAPRTTVDLLSIKNLADVGRYQAVILPAPEKKRETVGYLHMRMVHFYGGIQSPRLLEGLMRYIQDYTKIHARIEGPAIELSDPALFRSPFIYMAGPPEAKQTHTVLLSDVEKTQLGQYLRSGGFLYLEDLTLGIARQRGEPLREAGSLPFWTQMMEILRGVVGRDGKVFELPPNHPIYYSFYDFGDGPPLADPAGSNDLYGIEIGGRLVAVLSNLGISSYWDQKEGERMLQFGVNVVVYALTQQGGIAVAWSNPIYGLTKERRPVWETEKATVDSSKIPASIAFLRGRGENEEDSLWTVMFDGQVVGPPAEGELHDGLVLLSVPPGRPYTVTIRYGGKEQTLTFTPPPGGVTVLRFMIEQIFSRKRLGVQQEKRGEEYSVWKERQKGKRIAEVSWEELVTKR